ncbi:MAG: stage III sporulation protein AF [Corallococcus sp.]|nr:stage III sporulation protein AF [Corallococcus sp.]
MIVWAISVVGIILLTVLCDVVVPDGETNKYIKTVTSLIAVFVMLSPLPKLLNGDVDLDVIFPETSVANGIQNNYLEYVKKENCENTIRICTTAIEKEGICNAQITVTIGTTMALEHIDVDLSEAIFNKDMSAEHCAQIVKKAISSALNVKDIIVRVSYE